MMTEKRPAKKILRPVYRTSFSVTEELYESKTAKTPLYARTVRGDYRIDLLRLALAGTAVLSAALVISLLGRK